MRLLKLQARNPVATLNGMHSWLSAVAFAARVHHCCCVVPVQYNMHLIWSSTAYFVTVRAWHWHLQSKPVATLGGMHSCSIACYFNMTMHGIEFGFLFFSWHPLIWWWGSGRPAGHGKGKGAGGTLGGTALLGSHVHAKCNGAVDSVFLFIYCHQSAGLEGEAAMARAKELVRPLRAAAALPFLGLMFLTNIMEPVKGQVLAAMPVRWYRELPEIPILVFIAFSLLTLVIQRSVTAACDLASLLLADSCDRISSHCYLLAASECWLECECVVFLAFSLVTLAKVSHCWLWPLPRSQCCLLWVGGSHRCLLAARSLQFAVFALLPSCCWFLCLKVSHGCLLAASNC